MKPSPKIRVGVCGVIATRTERTVVRAFRFSNVAISAPVIYGRLIQATIALEARSPFVVFIDVRGEGGRWRRTHAQVIRGRRILGYLDHPLAGEGMEELPCA